MEYETVGIPLNRQRIGGAAETLAKWMGSERDNKLCRRYDRGARATPKVWSEGQSDETVWLALSSATELCVAATYQVSCRSIRKSRKRKSYRRMESRLCIVSSLLK